MAAQGEKEEQEIRVPESIPLFANCSLAAGSSPVPSGSDPIRLPERPEAVAEKAIAGAAGEEERRGTRRRCAGCGKRVGLTTGFRCRCGDVFCGTHRYSDRHACRYDYKAAARAAISRENPVVKAAKIVRI